MKRKSLFTILAIALMLVLSLSVLTACNKNKHDFSSKWKFDETNHWHECMTKKHNETALKRPANTTHIKANKSTNQRYKIGFTSQNAI